MVWWMRLGRFGFGLVRAKKVEGVWVSFCFAFGRRDY